MKLRGLSLRVPRRSGQLAAIWPPPEWRSVSVRLPPGSSKDRMSCICASSLLRTKQGWGSASSDDHRLMIQASMRMAVVVLPAGSPLHFLAAVNAV